MLYFTKYISRIGEFVIQYIAIYNSQK